MKKIIISMILALSLMTFIGCNHGNNKADDDVTPAELLKNIPVTTADLKDMLTTSSRNTSRAADSNETPSTSDLVPFILKTLVSEKDGFEFGKNKTLGVIGTFSDKAKNEFAKIYGDDTDEYLESFSVRNFGTAFVDMEDDKVTIFWYMPGWSPDNGTTNFPACYLYINGTYKNGNYENITIYGEGYCYCYDEYNNFEKAVPIYEKKYVSGDKVISKSVILKETTLTNNQVSKIEVTSTGVTKSTESYSSDLPTQTDINGYHQKIQEWYSTVN